MEKKYILTDRTKEVDGHTLHRIQAVKDFGNVKSGDLGGWIESESNLSQEGKCWVSDEAVVYGNATIQYNAQVYDHAVVYGNANICGYARIHGHAQVFGYSHIFWEAQVYDHAKIAGHTSIYGKALIYGHTWISGDDVNIYDSARVYDCARVHDKAEVFGEAMVFGQAEIRDKAKVCDQAKVCGAAVISGYARISGDAIVKCNLDYMDFHNNWISARHFTWTRSNNMWKVGCFYGTSEELIAKAYEDSEKSGKCYEAIVRVQELIAKNKQLLTA